MKIKDLTLCWLYLFGLVYILLNTPIQFEVCIILILFGAVIFYQKKEIIACNKSMKNQHENFYAILNHDLKPPTLAQVRILELLLNNNFGVLNKNQKEILNLSLNSCKHLYKMLRTETLTYEFIQKDKKLKYSTFDLTKIIQECISEISNELLYNDLKIDFENPYTYCFVYADKDEIKKVIDNFLFNVILNANNSTKINIYLYIENNNLILKIKTTGAYIKPKEMESYFRRDSSKCSKFNKIGMGLGLYLSKQIIEAHNGKVFAVSKKEEFNILGFQIPLAV